MLKHCPRLVPWTGWEEWNQVREWLYAQGDPEECRRGLRRVEAWRSRGRVPVSVDATAALAEARLADRERRARSASATVPAIAGPSDTSVRLVYAMALTRFVNGVVDSGQKGSHARSVVAIAAELGLPSWFVELRHEATHNALPSLACLRLASDHALGWLHANYWLAQHAQLPAVRAQAVEVLVAFSAQSLALLRQADEAQHELDAAAVAAAAAAASPNAAAEAPPPKPRAGAVRRLRSAVRASLDALAAKAVASLSRILPPNAVHTTLVDALLDDGLLAPPKPPAERELDAEPATAGPARAAFSADRLLQRWGPLLSAAHGHWSHFGMALIIATAHRLAAPLPDAPDGPSPAAARGEAEAAEVRRRGARADGRAAKRRRGSGCAAGAAEAEEEGGAEDAAAAEAEVACAGRQPTLQAWLIHFIDGSADGGDDEGGAVSALYDFDSASAPRRAAARAGGRAGGRAEPPPPPRSLLLGLLQLLLASPRHSECARDVVLRLLQLLDVGDATARRVRALLDAREAGDAALRGGKALAEHAAARAVGARAPGGLLSLAQLSQRARLAEGARATRAAALEAAAAAAAAAPSDEPAGSAGAPHAPVGPWRVAAPSGMRPCPIGCALDGSSPQLDVVAPTVVWLVRPMPAADSEGDLYAGVE